jgi:hypothetical protein
VRQIVGQPVFVPLYKLFLTYGKIFRLSFGPKTFVVISDAAMAKQVPLGNAALLRQHIAGSRTALCHLRRMSARFQGHEMTNGMGLAVAAAHDECEELLQGAVVGDPGVRHGQWHDSR